nr:IclR family transcriptional regulator [Ottowia sp.]
VRGRTVAALNVIVPPGRLDDASLRAQALERLRAAASELRQML